MSSRLFFQKEPSQLSTKGRMAVGRLLQQTLHRQNALMTSTRILSTIPMSHINDHYNISQQHQQHSPLHHHDDDHHRYPILLSAPETAFGTIDANEFLATNNFYHHQNENENKTYHDQQQEQHHHIGTLLSTINSTSTTHTHLFLSSSPETALGVVHSREMLTDDDTYKTIVGSKDNDVVIPVQQQRPMKDHHYRLLDDHQESHQQYLVSAPETALGVIHVSKWLPSISWMMGSMNSTRSTSNDEDDQMTNPTTIEAKERRRQQQQQDVPAYLVSSPESALGVIHAGEMLQGMKDGVVTSMSYGEESSSSSSAQLLADDTTTLLYTSSSPESATGIVWVTEMLDDTIKNALLEHERAKDTLPKTVSEALADPRPVVITSAQSPYTVVDVNSAWEGLCGYNREEAVHKNLGTLLQGPETDVQVANDMVNYLKRDHFARTVLTNYTKTGRKFQNRITVGVVSSGTGGRDDKLTSDPSTLYFVGVLEDLDATSNNKTVAMTA